MAEHHKTFLNKISVGYVEYLGAMHLHSRSAGILRVASVLDALLDVVLRSPWVGKPRSWVFVEHHLMSQPQQHFS